MGGTSSNTSLTASLLGGIGSMRALGLSIQRRIRMRSRDILISRGTGMYSTLAPKAEPIK